MERGPVTRRIPTPLLAALAVILALGIGIPVGLAAGSPGGTRAAPPGTAAPSTSWSAPPTSEPAPTEQTPATGSVPAPTSATPPAAQPPPGLSGAQRKLWDRMEMAGVDHQSCRGYPAGEQLAGVVASLECDIEDPSISQPIVYYQFDSAAAVEDYLALRGEEVDRTGDCDRGSEATGTWEVNGSTVGSYVCVDNSKDGQTYFKIVFSLDRNQTAAVVQDESAADVNAWWKAHAAGQFYEVGES